MVHGKVISREGDGMGAKTPRREDEARKREVRGGVVRERKGKEKGRGLKTEEGAETTSREKDGRRPIGQAG